MADPTYEVPEAVDFETQVVKDGEQQTLHLSFKAGPLTNPRDDELAALEDVLVPAGLATRSERKASKPAPSSATTASPGTAASDPKEA